jgi:hypothetical protein
MTLSLATGCVQTVNAVRRAGASIDSPGWRGESGAMATPRTPLPNIKSVGAFLVGLEQKILHRTPIQETLEQHSQRTQLTLDGMRVDLPPEPPARRPPKDRSGAKL